MITSTTAVRPRMAARSPKTTNRAIDTSRSPVFERTLLTMRSMVSAVCTAQSSLVAGNEPRAGVSIGREPTLWPVRPVLAVLAGAAVAGLGAAILGEYQFDGVTGVAAGLIFGLFVAEAAVVVARGGTPVLGLACAVLTVAALVWAVHASIGARADLPGDVPALAWVAMAAG